MVTLDLPTIIRNAAKNTVLRETHIKKAFTFQNSKIQYSKAKQFLKQMV